MKISAPFIRFVSIVFTLILPSSVLATVVVSQTIEEMVQGVPVVVRGHVGQVYALQSASSGRISTYAELRITEVIKGPKLTSLLMKQPGGTIGQHSQRVIGAARFAEGADAIFFLEHAADEPNVWVLNALAASKVDIQSSRFGELRAKRHLEGLAFYEQKAGQTSLRESTDEDLGSLDAFLIRLRNAARAR